MTRSIASLLNVQLRINKPGTSTSTKTVIITTETTKCIPIHAYTYFIVFSSKFIGIRFVSWVGWTHELESGTL